MKFGQDDVVDTKPLLQRGKIGSGTKCFVVGGLKRNQVLRLVGRSPLLQDTMDGVLWQVQDWAFRRFVGQATSGLAVACTMATSCERQPVPIARRGGTSSYWWIKDLNGLPEKRSLPDPPLRYKILYEPFNTL